MNIVDFVFLAVALVALGAMLAFSRVNRVIVWETLRHPFSSSRIEVDGDKVEVYRPAHSHPSQPKGSH